MKVAIKTTTALFCSVDQVGQVTLCSISSYTSRMYACMLFISSCFARVAGIEPTAPGFGDQCSTS